MPERITYHIEGGDEGYVTDSLDTFEDVLMECAKQTIDDCEQEINEGGYFSDDEEGDNARRKEVNDLYNSMIGDAGRCYRDGYGIIKVDPWYAKGQGMTFSIHIKSVEGF